MNAASSPETPTTETAKQRVARQMGMLAELAEIGVDLARALRDRVVAGVKVEGDPALGFTRLARAVRLTMAMEARLAEGPLFGAPSASAAPDAEAEDAPEDVSTRRTLVRGAVEIAIESDGRDRGDRVERERLMEALVDWLDDADDAVFASMSLDKLAERVCLDLGIAWDPRYWTETQAWAEAYETSARAAGARAWPRRSLNSCDSS